MPGEEANLTEMTEAVHVAAAIRGGASVIHRIQMRKIAQRLSMLTHGGLH
jgi:hypothetical protein